MHAPPTGADFDLDATALVCGEGDKVLSDQHFIFYNNLTSPEGTVRHNGDIRDGAAAGDDESIEVDLSQLTPQTDKVVFNVTIHDADSRGQSFGQVKNAYIRVVDTQQRLRARPLRPLRGRLHRDRDGLRRALPQRRRVEVPRHRPGLRLGSGRASSATTA